MPQGQAAAERRVAWKAWGGGGAGMGRGRVAMDHQPPPPPPPGTCRGRGGGLAARAVLLRHKMSPAPGGVQPRAVGLYLDHRIIGPQAGGMGDPRG